MSNRNAVAESFMTQLVDHYQSGDMPRAVFAGQAALEQADGWPMRGHVLHALATVASTCGDRPATLRYWRTFLSEVEGSEFPTMKRATSYYDAAYTMRLLGSVTEALHYYRQALPVFRSEGRHVVQCLQAIAWAECLDGGDGRVARAAAALDEARELAADDDDRNHQAVGEAFLYAVSGDHERAMGAIAAIMADDSGYPADVRSQAAYVAGRISVDTGSRHDAEHWLSEMERWAGGNQNLAHDVRWLSDRIKTMA